MTRARLTLEMDEQELTRLSEAARNRHVHLDGISTAEFVQLVAAITPKVSEKPSREMRLSAIASVHGMWKNDPEKQQDGLEYQREIRAES